MPECRLHPRLEISLKMFLTNNAATIMTLVSECKNICFVGCVIQGIYQGVDVGNDLINNQL